MVYFSPVGGLEFFLRSHDILKLRGKVKSSEKFFHVIANVFLRRFIQEAELKFQPG